MRRRFLPVLLLCLVFAFAGLTGCLSRPPLKKQFFALRPPMPASHQGFAIAELSDLTVDPLYSGRPLVYRLAANEFESDPYAEWMLDPREMLFDAVGGLLRTERSETWVPPKKVECHVAVFGGDFNGNGSEAVVTLNWAAGSGQQRVTRTIEVREPLRERTAAEVVAGLERALRAAVAELGAEIRTGGATP
jgi:uncharacterized lipoprotein YmbA